MEEQAKYETEGKALVASSPTAILQLAIGKDYPPEFLSKMMDLQERFERNEARKAYVVAMAAFKASPPEIEKDKKVSYKAGAGTTEYHHASLANVTRKINDGLSKHGLSASWTTKQDNGHVTVTCKITHCMGHSEETSLTASPDTSGSKNAIQAIGSTISYLERYTVLALTGLATSDMDDDGQTTEIEYLSQDQQTEITDLMLETDANEKKFLEYLGAESLEKIPASQYKKALTALKTKEKAKKDKKADVKA